MHEINIPVSVRQPGHLFATGQLVLILLVKHNAYFQTKIEDMFFNRVFFLET